MWMRELAVAALLWMACWPAGVAAEEVAPPLPAWAAPLAGEFGIMAEHRNASFEYNRELVAHANEMNITFDLVMWGDSLTSFTLFYPENAAIWEQHFGEGSGWAAARLGVGGSTVEELAWRIMAGGEKLKKDPLVALLLIGINNPEPQVAARRLGRLLDWMAAEMPGTQPLVLAPLPQLWARGHHEALAAAYRPLLAARGVPMSTCGQSLNPASPRAYQDGLHLAAPAYRALFHCLKPLLTRLRDEQAAKRAQQQQEGAGIAPGGAGLEPAAAPAPAPALADPAAPEGRLQAGD